MTIAVLGGSFDPVHLGHVWVAQQILEKRPEINEVWLMPAAAHQWKRIQASEKDRVAMLQSIKSDRIKISDLELVRGGVSYTIDTIRSIKKQFGHTIYWIVGSDIIPELPKWEKKDELTQDATFLVFPRDPHTIPDELPGGFDAVRDKDLIVTNISSTAIRERISAHKPIRGFVPEEVASYIEEKGLYT